MTTRKISWKGVTGEEEKVVLNFRPQSYVITPLPGGVSRHDLKVSTDQDISALGQYIYDDDFVALKACLPKPTHFVLEEQLKQTLGDLISRKFDVKVNNFHSYLLGDTDVSTPATLVLIPRVNSESVYVRTAQAAEFQAQLDLDILLDYSVVGTSLDDDVSAAPLSDQADQIVYVADVPLAPSDPTILDDINNDLDCWESSGIVSVYVTQAQYELLYELTVLWPITMVKERPDDEHRLVALRAADDVDFGMPLQIWVMHTIDKIEKEQIPEVYSYSLTQTGEIVRTIKEFNSFAEMTSGDNLDQAGRVPGGRSSSIVELERMEPLNVEGEVRIEPTSGDMFKIVITTRTDRLEIDVKLNPGEDLPSSDCLKQLWARGELLTAHARAYYLKTGEISSSPLRRITTSELLQKCESVS